MATIEVTPPAEVTPEDPADSKRLRWFEVSLVLLITCSGYIQESIYLLIGGRGAFPSVGYSHWVSGIIHETIGLLLLGYVLSRRRIRFKDLGLRWSFRDLITGLGVVVVALMVYRFGYFFVHAIHFAWFPSAPSRPTASQIWGHPSIIAVPFFLMNPFFEELIVRAYLMTEVRALTGSWVWSVLVSVTVQTSYHLYYGWEGALSLAFQFAVFAIYYARTRRATPIVFAHGFFDLWALIQLWGL